MKEKKILVIDNDKEVLNQVQFFFNKTDWIILLAKNFKDGLKKVQSEKPDIVIIDSVINGTSGLGILQFIKDKFPEISIIFMITNGSQPIALDAVKRGADDYLIKPFMIEQLTLVVDKIIEDKKIREENEILKEKLEYLKKIEPQESRKYIVSDEVWENIFKNSSEYLKIAEIVAEEFINPLSVFGGYLQFLIRQHSENWNSEILQKMEKILNKIKKTIKDLMFFSNSDHTTNFEWVNVNYIIEEALRNLESECNEKNLHIIKKYQKNIPNIKANSNQLYYALYDVIINAIYFTAKEGRISISTSFDESKMYIKISDNGQGTSKDNLKKIFTPFFTTKPLVKGLGL